MTINVPIVDGWQWILVPFAVIVGSMVVKWFWSWITG
jgi:hypothetical protein